MTRLCGAWSLAGDRVIGQSEKAAMRAQLGPICRETEAGPLWLAAADDRSAREGAVVLGLEGFLCGREPEELLKDYRSREAFWNGHYAMAYADTQARRLVLACDPGGGERLFYAEVDGLLLFSATVRAILAHPAVKRALDPTALPAALMHHATFLDPDTLFEGIKEVPAGERVLVKDGKVSLERRPHPLLWPARRGGDFAGAARRLRKTLKDATAAALGHDGKAAISLSGGTDSSCLAALAVELLGPERVKAFTYCFDDPAHPSEAPEAEAVCRHLGIKHELVKIPFGDFRAALPAAFWHLEASGHRSGRINPAKVILGRRIAEQGYEKTIAGDGMEHLLNARMHQHYMLALPERLARLPLAEKTLGHWRTARFPHGTSRGRARFHKWLGKLTIEPPPEELYSMVVGALLHHGVVKDAAPFYPAELRELAQAAHAGPHLSGALERMEPRTLEGRLRLITFWHYFKTRCLFRKAKMSRELGSTLLSPILFADCIDAAPGFLCGDKPEGKRLLREAFKDDLPRELLHRPKQMDQAVVSMDWLRRLLDSLEPAAGPLERFRPLVPGPWDEMLPHLREPLLWYGLWQRMFVESEPRTRPPAWEELETL